MNTVQETYQAKHMYWPKDVLWYNIYKAKTRAIYRHGNSDLLLFLIHVFVQSTVPLNSSSWKSASSKLLAERDFRKSKLKVAVYWILFTSDSSKCNDFYFSSGFNYWLLYHMTCIL